MMRGLSRRSVLGGVLGGAVAPLVVGSGAALAGPQLASAYRTPMIKFRVERDGNPIGYVTERFQTQGDRLQVDVRIGFEVKLAFITIYRYEHLAREFWQAGCLVRLDSVTNDDGDAQSVRVRQNGSGLDVQGIEAPFTASPDALPSSYWHPRFPEVSSMIDSQKGRLIEFTIDDLGAQKIGVAGNQSIDANRYAMRGDIDLDFWYDRDRRWRKMEFTIAGGRMEYFDIRPEPQDEAVFDQPLTTGVTLPAV